MNQKTEEFLKFAALVVILLFVGLFGFLTYNGMILSSLLMKPSFIIEGKDQIYEVQISPSRWTPVKRMRIVKIDSKRKAELKKLGIQSAYHTNLKDVTVIKQGGLYRAQINQIKSHKP